MEKEKGEGGREGGKKGEGRRVKGRETKREINDLLN